MKNKCIGLFLFCLIAGFAYSQEEYITVPSIEFGLTAMVVDFAFPGFDLDFVFPFYVKGINSLAFKNSWFVYIRGNAFYKPIFTQFGPIAEIQYRINTNNGFLFTMETGLGIIGEFFTDKVYAEGKGFYQHPGVPYGLFSVSGRIGGSCMPKFGIPLQIALMLGYRIQFPYNISYNDYYIMGLSLGYRFNLKR